MKTILVLAPHPELVSEIRAGLPADRYRVLHRASLEEAEPLLAHQLADVCVLDQDLNGVQGSWLVEKVRRKAPRIPLLVVASVRQPEWEEDACLKGVKQVLGKPLRPRMLESIMEQILSHTTNTVQSPAPAIYVPPPETPMHLPNPYGTGLAGPSQNLQVLRDFSAILTHSLDADAMLRQFLQLMREITGVNRASIFLRPSVAPFLATEAKSDAQTLSAACGLGLPPTVLDVVKLSFASGIGSHILRSGRILRRSSPEAANVDIQREFDLLGAQVAIPILDREQVLGVALFDARVTGEPLVNAELELVFHLLEQVGLAVKNIRLHDQVTANHELMADVMRELSSACVVVGRDLNVLHANRMARKYFGQTGNRAGELEFSDLPSLLGTKVFQVLKTGSALASFRYVPEQEPDTVYQVTISPLHRAGSAVPSSVLMIVEDRTQSELLRKLEQEAATAKREHELLKDMARKMAERIGNIILPVGIYAEMLGPNWKDAAVRGEIENGLRESALKGLRLAELMRNFEGASGASDQAIPLAQLIDEAVQEAHKHHPKIKVKCQNDFTKRPVFIPGDRKALKLAMTELMLNALQANPKTGTAEIEVTEVSAALGGTVCIEIKDNGPGFTSEARAQAGKPFFSTESAGAGLGLLITSRILERNRGKLEIMESGQQGVVRVTLPVEKPATK